MLALRAAAVGLAITRLVLYEPPFRPDDSYPPPPADLAEQVTRLVAAGRRGDAVELYQIKAIGIPQDVVVQMRHAPFRPGLEAIAHTLAYDAAVTGDMSALEEQRSEKYRHALIAVVNIGVRAGQLGGTAAWLSSHPVSHT